MVQMFSMPNTQARHIKHSTLITTMKYTHNIWQLILGLMKPCTDGAKFFRIVYISSVIQIDSRSSDIAHMHVTSNQGSILNTVSHTRRNFSR